MCGIIGCVAEHDVSRILIEGLRRLEYRGYDSAGIAVLHEGHIRVQRAVGKLGRLEEALDHEEMSGHQGLGHTRWATHGKPSEENAHPHRDCTGDLVLIHNGIIENFVSLKRELVAKGHKFVSETDTEVLAHLIESCVKDDLAASVRTALLRVEGAYAVVVMHRRFPGTIVGSRRDNPLVVGLGDRENFIASDVPALLDHTRDVVFVHDGEVAEVTLSGVKLTTLDGTPVTRPTTRIEWDLVMAEKGGFKHFMLKEIHEQGRVVSDALLGRIVEGTGETYVPDLKLDAALAKRIEKIVIVACGTSHHAGLVARGALEALAKLPVEVDIASEFRYREPMLDDKTLLVAISQSGETADTIGAVRRGRQSKAHPIAICNVLGSSITRECDGVLYTHAGPEIGVASTKAFVAQIVALHLLAMRLAELRGTASREVLAARATALRSVRGCIERALKREADVVRIAKTYHPARDFLFLGRGVNFPIALEGALKLKELSYIHAEGYPAGEMKHGPIALIDGEMPILAIATKGIAYSKMRSNIEEVRTRGGKVIALITEGDKQIPSVAHDVIEVPEITEELSPLVNIVPLQLLAYHIAVLRGCDVDQPRNLAKSVTVE
ncbi:MAG: glutamine--fructose-6-phosphate transaminase (isomerizing) [Planctomycetes bacterium]|nr:glutamine--fructose-6-phosphate transaminase (isomerizing) [Planctomycetota bacterium]